MFAYRCMLLQMFLPSYMALEAYRRWAIFFSPREKTECRIYQFKRRTA